MGGKNNGRGNGVVNGVAYVVFVVMIVPVISIGPAAFTHRDYLSLPSIQQISLKHLWKFLDPSQGWLSSFGDSLVVAIASSAAATALGTMAAIGIWRLAERRLVQLALLWCMFPMVVPLISLALGTYWVWVRLGLFDTYLGLIIAHVVQAVPFVVITVLSSLSGFDRRIERAALSLGASPWQFSVRVLLPSIRTGVSSGAALAFIVSWDELLVSLFATGRGIVTLPKRMWEALLSSQDPVVAVASSVLILATLALMAAHLLRLRQGDART